MACELVKAIELLNKKTATKNAISKIIKQGEIAEEAFGKLVVEVTGEKAPKITKFANKLGGYIRKATGVTVEKNPTYVLDQVANGVTTELTLGVYNRSTNTVKIGGYVSKKDIKTTLEEGVYNQLVQAYDAKTANAVVQTSDYKKNVNTTVSDMFKVIKDARGTNLLLHELTHVGAVEYMTENPDALATARITTIYNHLFQNHEKLGVTEGYWKTSVDEFIAEAMSNPLLIKELMTIKPNKPVERLSNLYEVLLNTLTNMLGLEPNKTESLFDILLDANVSILQDQELLETSGKVSTKPVKQQTKATNTTSPVKVDKAPVEAERGDIKLDIEKYKDDTAEDIAEQERMEAEQQKVATEVTPVIKMKPLVVPKDIKTEYVKDFLALNPLKMSVAKVLDALYRNISIGKQDSASSEAISKAIEIMKDNLQIRIDNDTNMVKLTEEQIDKLANDLEQFTKERKAVNKQINEITKDQPVNEYIANIKSSRTGAKGKAAKQKFTDKLDKLFELFNTAKELGNSILEIRNKQTTSVNTFKVLTKLHGTQYKTGTANKFGDTDKDYKTSANILGVHLTAKKATSILANKEVVTMEDIRTVFANPKKDIAQFRANSGMDTVYNNSVFTYPHMMLLRNSEDKSTNYNTVLAVKIAVEKYIADNYNTLMKLTPKDIASFYGVKEENWGEIDPELIEAGIPSTYMVDTISKDIGKMLGLKAIVVKDKDGKITQDNSDYLDKVLNGLALAGIRNTQLSEGRLERIVIKQKNGSLLNTYRLSVPEGIDRGAIFVKGRNDKSDHALYVKSLTDRFEINKEDKTLIHTTPSTRKKGSVAKKRDSMVDVTPTSVKAVEAYEAEVWNTNDPALDLIEETLEGKDGLWNMLSLLEYEDVDTKEEIITYETKVSIEGKNQQIESDLANVQELLAMRKNGETSTGIFFRWFVASNGRPMIDAKGGLNPQGIKLHRYIVNAQRQHGVVDTDTDPWSDTMFKLGFAQGLGFAIDKRKIEESIEFAEALLTKENLAELRQNFKEGKRSPSIVVTINGKDESIKFKEPGHSALAITEGQKYYQANGSPFNTTMTLEIDGLTNGFGHKMMNFLATDDARSHTISPAAISWLGKIGFEFKSQEEVLDIVEQIQIGKVNKKDTKGIVDAYLTLADDIAPDLKGEELITEVVKRVTDKFDKLMVNATIKEQVEVEKDLVDRFGTANRDEIQTRIRALLEVMPSLRDGDGELSGFVRDLMKDPFMTFGYGAGATAMSNGIAAALIEDAMTYVLRAPVGDKKAGNLVKALGFGPKSKLRRTLRKNLQEKPFGAIVNDNGDSLLDAFRGLIRGVYGDSVETVMGNNFKGMQEINKAMLGTAGMIFDIFEVGYNAELIKYGVVPGTVPTQGIHEEILTTLKSKGMLPVIMTPDSTSYDNGMAMYKMESAPAATNQFGVATVPRVDDIPFETVNSRKRKLIGPGAGPIALLTHHWDAFGTSLQGAKRSLLQIFDAYLLGVNQHDIVKDINKDFVETTLLNDMSQISVMEDGLTRIIKNAEKSYGAEYSAFVSNIDKEENRPDGVRLDIAELNVAAEARTAQAKEQKTFTSQQFAMDKGAGYTYTNENGVEDIGTRKEVVKAEKLKVQSKQDNVVSMLQKIDTSKVSNNTGLWVMRNGSPNFGNPFYTKTPKNKQAGDVLVGGNGEASVAYYNWLKDGTLPDVKMTEKDIEALTTRRDVILANLDMVRNAGKLRYNGTARNNVISHVNALIAIADEAATTTDIAAQIKAVNEGKPAAKHTAKELKKVALANQYIGKGSPNSSTARYAKVYGDKANTGQYTADDVIWVSSNGKRNNRVDPLGPNGVKDLVDKAITASATIVMDTKAHIDKTQYYNIGEVALAEYMSNNGYIRDNSRGAGVWSKQDMQAVIDRRVEALKGIFGTEIPYNGKDDTSPEVINDALDSAVESLTTDKGTGTNIQNQTTATPFTSTQESATMSDIETKYPETAALVEELMEGCKI